MSFYPNGTVRITAGNSGEPAIIPTGIILHVSSSANATSLYGWFNGPSGGIESHFHVDVLGRVEQYRSTTKQADANYRGNGYGSPLRGYISIETQGGDNGSWNEAQIDSIIALCSWLLAEHSTIERKVSTGTFSGGLGWHTMWGAGKGTNSWSNARGKTCPGAARIAQCKSIVFPAILAGKSGASAGPRMLSVGASGEDVRRIQARLSEMGHTVDADGDFGPATKAAVIAVQSANGLPADGIVGPDTLAVMDRWQPNLGLATEAIDFGPEIKAGTVIRAGNRLTSAGGEYALTLQSDGNVVLYRGSQAVWQTSVRGDRLALQADGNLVLYRGSQAVWHTQTGGKGDRLALQNDGNIVLYGPAGAVWQSGTYKA